MKLQDIVRELQSFNLLGLAEKYIDDHIQDFTNPNEEEVKWIQGILDSIPGDPRIRDLDASSFNNPALMKEHCRSAFAEARIVYLKSLIEKFAIQLSNDEGKTNMEDYKRAKNTISNALSDIDFMSIPLPNGETMQVIILLRVLRNAIAHGDTGESSKFKKETGFSSAKQLLLANIRYHSDSFSRSIEYFNPNEPPDPTPIECLGNIVINECMTLIDACSHCLKEGGSELLKVTIQNPPSLSDF